MTDPTDYMPTNWNPRRLDRPTPQPTCWEAPELCPGCAYCDDGSTLTASDARRLELGATDLKETA